MYTTFDTDHIPGRSINLQLSIQTIFQVPEHLAIPKSNNLPTGILIRVSVSETSVDVISLRAYRRSSGERVFLPKITLTLSMSDEWDFTSRAQK